MTEIEMSKKVELSVEEQAQLVLRMLSKEEPVVDCAACEDCRADVVSVRINRVRHRRV